MKNFHRRCAIACALAVSSLLARAQTPPQITTQPASQTNSCGGDVTFTVTASGSSPLAYIWIVDGSPVSQATTNATLSLTNIFAESGTKFSVIVSNSFGAVLSDPATLTVVDSPVPVLSSEPKGPGSVMLSWPHVCMPFTLLSAETLSDKITNWVAVAAPLTVDNSSNYVSIDTIFASNSFYKLISIPPHIVDSPVSATRGVGSNVTFSVLATNPPSPQPLVLLYQWRLNGVVLDNETNDTLSLTNLQRGNGGSYDVIVGNQWHAVASQPATLKVSGAAFAMTNDFASTSLITNLNFAIDGTNEGATKEPFEPNHAGGLGGKSVWLRWQPAKDGIATLDTTGSSFDTLLGVYTGSTLAGLTLVASDDDSGGFYTSKVQFNATAGTEYQIAIDGLAGSSGLIDLNASFVITDEEIPQITVQPQSQTSIITSNVLFSVGVVSDFPPITYQWRANGINILGNPSATSSTLVISNAQLADVARYDVVVSNSVRSVVSTIAYLDLVTMRTGANSNTIPAIIEFRDKLEFRFDPPEGGGQALAGISRPRSRPKPHLSLSAGQISIATDRLGLTQSADPTVCTLPVARTLYLDVVPTAPGTLQFDTIRSQPIMDTVLKVTLPNFATPCTDNVSPFLLASQISVLGVNPGKTYHVTIGVKSGAPPGILVLTSSLFF